MNMWNRTLTLPVGRTFLAALTLSLLCSVTATQAATPTAPATRPSTQPGYKDRYGVISERNMFLRDRRTRESSRSSYSSTSRPSYTPPPPEATYVLTGIVLEEDGQIRAYIEDTRGAKILRLAVGDNIARGSIAEIQIDGILYESSGKSAWVEVGKTLAGLPFIPPQQVVYVPAQTTTPSPGATTTPSTNPTEVSTTGPSDSAAPPGSVAVNPNDPSLTPEQRLKLKRQMELQKIQGNK